MRWFIASLLLSTALYAQQGSQPEPQGMQAAAAPNVASPYVLSESELRKLLVKKVTPTYPIEARLNRIAGNVKTEIVVGTDGSVKKVTVLWSEHPSLARAVLEAIPKWKFKRYIVNGVPVEFTGPVVTSFELRGW